MFDVSRELIFWVISNISIQYNMLVKIFNEIYHDLKSIFCPFNSLVFFFLLKLNHNLHKVFHVSNPLKKIVHAQIIHFIYNAIPLL